MPDYQNLPVTFVLTKISSHVFFFMSITRVYEEKRKSRL